MRECVHERERRSVFDMTFSFALAYFTLPTPTAPRRQLWRTCTFRSRTTRQPVFSTMHRSSTCRMGLQEASHRASTALQQIQICKFRLQAHSPGPSSSPSIDFLNLPLHSQAAIDAPNPRGRYPPAFSKTRMQKELRKSKQHSKAQKSVPSTQMQ
jgi:hypothetical protein